MKKKKEIKIVTAYWGHLFNKGGEGGSKKDKQKCMIGLFV